jgi:hypothetical protein
VTCDILHLNCRYIDYPIIRNNFLLRKAEQLGESEGYQSFKSLVVTVRGIEPSTFTSKYEANPLHLDHRIALFSPASFLGNSVPTLWQVLCTTSMFSVTLLHCGRYCVLLVCYVFQCYFPGQLGFWTGWTWRSFPLTRSCSFLELPNQPLRKGGKKTR